MLACGQASKQAWPNSSRYKHRGQCQSRMQRADPSARQTRQSDLRQSIRLMQSATPSASHRGSHASQGLSSMQHTARLPVSRPAWLPHRSGTGAQRIFDVGVNQALTAGTILSSHMALVVEIYEGTAGTGHFRIRQLQPDQPDELAYKLILAHDYNFTGWLSVVNCWSWLVGLPTCGEVPEENLLHFFWHCIGGSEEGLLDSVRFVAGKSPLEDFKALGRVRLKSSALVRRGVEELNYGLWLTLLPVLRA